MSDDIFIAFDDNGVAHAYDAVTRTVQGRKRGMMEKPDLDWLIKCRQCKHYYQVQADSDEVRCRLKYCRYEPAKEVVEFERLQQQLVESEEEQNKIIEILNKYYFKEDE